MMLQALLWDVDGTLAETERDGHRVAFNRAFVDMGLAWQWDVAYYGELLRVFGGRERLLHDLQQRSDAPPTPAEREALARELHRRKNAHYVDIIAAGSIALREGVPELLDEAASRGLRQAIATTSSRGNVEALLSRHLGAQWARRFGTMVCGEDVARKKPDPEVFNKAVQALGLPPQLTLALEDSPGGVAAARAAAVPVVVTRSAYFADDAVEQVVALGPGLHDVRGWRPAPPNPHTPGARDEQAGAGTAARRRRITLDDLQHWHARSERVSHIG
jgi:HAD superfamily hydrolase (TIGR01509 family)